MACNPAHARPHDSAATARIQAVTRAPRQSPGASGSRLGSTPSRYRAAVPHRPAPARQTAATIPATSGAGMATSRRSSAIRMAAAPVAAVAFLTMPILSSGRSASRGACSTAEASWFALIGPTPQPWLPKLPRGSSLVWRVRSGPAPLRGEFRSLSRESRQRRAATGPRTWRCRPERRTCPGGPGPEERRRLRGTDHGLTRAPERMDWIVRDS